MIRSSKKTKKSKLDNSLVSKVFIESQTKLKIHLSRFFNSKHDIEDILQDAYIRAIQAEKDHEIHAPKAFLYKVCSNLAINHHAKAAQKLTDYVADFDELAVLIDTVTPEDRVEQEKRFIEFCSSVKSLPPQCRKVFVLKKIYGLPNQEIADRLKISVSTVDKHLGRGLIACRKYLKSKGYSFS